MRIKLVYDIFGPSGPFANGFNYNYINDAWENDFLTHHPLIQSFNKNYTQLSVYDCNLNLSTHRLDKIHISDVSILGNKANHDGGDDIFLYTIHPFGSIDTCLGNNLNYHENTHCFEFISSLAKKYINELDNFYLTLDYSSEGDINPDLFDNLHKICKKLNINEKKVIVISASMNTRDLYQEYLNNNPQTSEFYSACYTWSILPKRGELKTYFENPEEFTFNGHKNNISFMSEDDFNSNLKREKKCLIYNRRIAPHRVIILSLLQNDDLLKQVSYSIDLSLHYNSNDLGLELAKGHNYLKFPYIENEKMKSNMINGFFKLKKIGKSVVDYDNVGGVWGFGFEHKEPYLNTYFSVITETLFYEQGHYISEKTFKGIQHLHPFVVIGKPGILKQLRKWGFKTFSDFWDESYDEISNDSLRMESIYNVIKKLIEKTDDEWVELNKKLLPILIHNRKTLLSFDENDVADVYIENLNKLLKNEPNQENYSLL